MRTVLNGSSWTFGRVAIALGAALAFTMSVPALAEGDHDMEMVEKGHNIYLTAGGIGCSTCHGDYAEGDVGIGPYNRGLTEYHVTTALSGIEDMEFLQDELDAEQIKQVAAYLGWLGDLQLIKVLVKRGRYMPDEASVYPGTEVQLVIQNAASTERTFFTENMGFDNMLIAGREDGVVIWTAPETEGEFTVGCIDCKVKGQFLTIKVSKAAKPHINYLKQRQAGGQAASAPPGQ